MGRPDGHELLRSSGLKRRGTPLPAATRCDRGEVDLFWMLGGNFLETLPDEDRSREALRRPRLRVHQDVMLSSSMLVAGADVLLLPATTRYESSGNSMVQRQVDPLTGAGRDAIFISADDMARLRLDEGAAVRLRSASGTFRGTLKRAPIKPGNLEVHWPEGMPLLSGSTIDPESMEPDYNAVVTIEAVG